LGNPGADFEEYDVNPKAEFELNVGGRAALQRRLRNYQPDLSMLSCVVVVIRAKSSP
jgi:hypothetical protein